MGKNGSEEGWTLFSTLHIYIVGALTYLEDTMQAFDANKYLLHTT